LRQPAATPAGCAKDEQFYRDQFFRFVKNIRRLLSSILGIGKGLLRFGKENFESIVLRPMARVRDFD
jgi:hypothetical protein